MLKPAKAEALSVANAATDKSAGGCKHKWNNKRNDKALMVHVHDRST